MEASKESKQSPAKTEVNEGLWELGCSRVGGPLDLVEEHWCFGGDGGREMHAKEMKLGAGWWHA